jgi:hypothetical protein
MPRIILFLQKMTLIWLYLVLASACQPGKYEKSGEIVIHEGGNLLWYNQPAGIYYEGEHKRTYLTWMDDERNVEVCYYDASDKFLSPVNRIKRWNYLDDHGQPVIHVLQA